MYLFVIFLLICYIALIQGDVEDEFDEFELDDPAAVDDDYEDTVDVAPKGTASMSETSESTDDGDNEEAADVEDPYEEIVLKKITFSKEDELNFNAHKAAMDKILAAEERVSGGGAAAAGRRSGAGSGSHHRPSTESTETTEKSTGPPPPVWHTLLTWRELVVAVALVAYGAVYWRGRGRLNAAVRRWAEASSSVWTGQFSKFELEDSRWGGPPAPTTPAQPTWISLRKSPCLSVARASGRQHCLGARTYVELRPEHDLGAMAVGHTLRLLERVLGMPADQLCGTVGVGAVDEDRWAIDVALPDTVPPVDVIWCLLRRRSPAVMHAFRTTFAMERELTQGSGGGGNNNNNNNNNNNKTFASLASSGSSATGGGGAATLLDDMFVVRTESDEVSRHLLQRHAHDSLVPDLLQQYGQWIRYIVLSDQFPNVNQRRAMRFAFLLPPTAADVAALTRLAFHMVDLLATMRPSRAAVEGAQRRRADLRRRQETRLHHERLEAAQERRASKLAAMDPKTRQHALEKNKRKALKSGKVKIMR